MGVLVRTSQAKRSPIFEIHDQQQGSIPLLIWACYSQISSGDRVLNLLNAMNLSVPSILRRDQWLWSCGHKYPPDFRISESCNKSIPPIDMLSVLSNRHK